MWSGLDLTLVILMGLVMSVAGLFWLWREYSRPSLVDRQEVTIAKMLNRADLIQDDHDKLRREFDDFRRATHEAQEGYETELSELRDFIDEWWRGWKLIFEQMEAAKLTPVWQPKPPPTRRKHKASTAPELSGPELAEAIAQRFDIEEMNSLAFDIGIEPDAFGGVTRAARARELVDLARRRGVMAALEKRRRELRP